jgi:hypothetical protein
VLPELLFVVGVFPVRGKRTVFRTHREPRWVRTDREKCSMSDLSPRPYIIVLAVMGFVGCAKSAAAAPLSGPASTTPSDATPRGRVIMVNATTMARVGAVEPLALTTEDQIPVLHGEALTSNKVTCAPVSITFIVLPKANNTACANR